MAKTSNPKILFLDDQLVQSERDYNLGRYLEVLNPRNVDLIESSDIDSMFDSLKYYFENNIQIHGFLIDLMLPHIQTNNGRGRDFSSWGVPSLKLRHDVGGAQVIKLMRHKQYENQRSDSKCPLHIVSHYYNVPLVLFTTYEDGLNVAKEQGIRGLCDDFIWKDSTDTEMRLTHWIQSISTNMNTPPGIQSE